MASCWIKPGSRPQAQAWITSVIVNRPQLPIRYGMTSSGELNFGAGSIVMKAGGCAGSGRLSAGLWVQWRFGSDVKKGKGELPSSELNRAVYANPSSCDRMC